MGCEGRFRYLFPPCSDNNRDAVQIEKTGQRPVQLMH